MKINGIRAQSRFNEHNYSNDGCSGLSAAAEKYRTEWPPVENFTQYTSLLQVCVLSVISSSARNRWPKIDRLSRILDAEVIAALYNMQIAISHVSSKKKNRIYYDL